MTKQKSIKRALVLSALSLLLCISMLVGSTFAWFTDSVTSGNNRIVAGNLEVDLLMDKEQNGTYTSIANGTGDIFDENTVATDSNKTLWEPGKTQIVYLAVDNIGTLDLKYNILLNVTDNGLVGALEYAVIDGAKAADLAGATAWTDLKANPNVQIGEIKAGTMLAAPNGALKAEDTDYFALAVHMKENADNNYQGKNVVIDVLVQATQLASEKDSFGTDYDALATFTGGFHWIEPIEEDVAPEADNTFTYESEDGSFKVTGTDDATPGVKVTLTPASTDANLVIQGSSVLSYDIDVEGRDTASDVKIEMYIGTNLSQVVLYHEGALMEASKYSYNSLTGILTFTTNSFSVYSISVAAPGTLPLAQVKELDNLTIKAKDMGEITLDCGYVFLPTQTEQEAIETGYSKWHADFVISVDKDVALVGEAGLAGYYSAWCELIDHQWLAIPMDGATLTADDELRLVAALGATVNYGEVCKYAIREENLINGFLCGAYADESMDGVTLNVELRLYEIDETQSTQSTLDCETGKYVTIGTYSYTF